MPLPEAVEQIDIAPPAAAEVEVLADDDMYGVEGVDEDGAGEVLCGHRGQDVVEAQDQDMVGPVPAGQPGPLVQRDDRGGVPGWSGDRRRMGVEGDQDERDPTGVGEAPGLGEYAGVAAVQAVEHPEHHHGRSQVVESAVVEALPADRG